MFSFILLLNFLKVTFDSEPKLEIPLGPGGGILDKETGLIHKQGPVVSRPFDPFLGIYLYIALLKYPRS